MELADVVAQRERNQILAGPIETSVQARGALPEAVWLDRTDALEKGVRRCEAIFRMIGEVRDFSVLDLGCGPGLALHYLQDRYGDPGDLYLGIDISAALIEVAQGLWPRHRFELRDILTDPLPPRQHDFTAINGVLTAKYDLPYEDMERFVEDLLRAAWETTDVALSFNVMSPHVDWTRPDLFHWPIDRAIGFCVGALSRHVNVLADYGLYEYTVQVYRTPISRGPIPRGWQGEHGM